MTYPWIWSRTYLSNYLWNFRFIYILLKLRQNAFIRRFALLSSMWTKAKYCLISKLGQIFFSTIFHKWIIMTKIYNWLCLAKHLKTTKQRFWAVSIQLLLDVGMHAHTPAVWRWAEEESRRKAGQNFLWVPLLHWSEGLSVDSPIQRKMLIDAKTRGPSPLSLAWITGVCWQRCTEFESMTVAFLSTNTKNQH